MSNPAQSLRQATLARFTTLYRSGDPFTTDAVVKDVGSLSFAPSEAPRPFEMKREDRGTALYLPMQPEDCVFGLGEHLGGMNKRGRQYRFFAKDESHHSPDKSALYGSHPFMIFDAGERSFGMFLDFPSELVFDVGFTDKDALKIWIPSHDFDLYVFDSADHLATIREMLELTGAPYVPPKWSFGFQQCRYSYPDAETIRGIAKNFRDRDIPCDAIYMDIDYMEDYKVFTIDEKVFPDFPEFVKEMREQGFRLVPILDPGVKVEKGYSVYEEGCAKGYFCVDEGGKEFTGSVWPGLTHFPDFLNPECRAWWGDLYRMFTELGVNSFWNDMNEPAIFFTPGGLGELAGEIEYLKGRVDLGKDPVAFLPKIWGWWHNERYYDEFYHRVPSRKEPIRHRDVHNLYGFNMARASAEGLMKLMPGKRPFVLSRSSYIGLHRYAVIWTGDNHSWWEHMLTQMRMVTALNMCGFFYCGADVGGFGADASPELVVRWMQLGAFTPLYRNHSTKDSRFQEPWAFDDECCAMIRDTIRLRYSLLPYAYSEFVSAVGDLRPFVSPLFLEFEGRRIKEVEDQFMYGRSLMVAPVHVANARGRYVHLPGGPWLRLSASGSEAVTGGEANKEVLAQGDHYIEAPLSDVPLFVRENHLIVASEPTLHSGEKKAEVLWVTGLVTSEASFSVFVDDGESFDYQKGIFSTLEIRAVRGTNGLVLTCEPKENEKVPLGIRKVHFEIYAADGSCERREVQV